MLLMSLHSSFNSLTTSFSKAEGHSEESGHFFVSIVTELSSPRQDSSVISRDCEWELWRSELRHGEEEERLRSKKLRRGERVRVKWKSWRVKKDWKWERERGLHWEREGERERVKQLYLHQSYLASRLQNNGRKQVHGTFPLPAGMRCPYPGSCGPHAALRSTDTSLCCRVEGAGAGYRRPGQSGKQGSGGGCCVREGGLM